MENTRVAFELSGPGTGRVSRLMVTQIPLAQAYLPPSKVLLQLEESPTCQQLWSKQRNLYLGNQEINDGTKCLGFCLFYVLFSLTPLLPQIASHCTFAQKSFLQPFLTSSSYPVTYGRVYTRPEFPNCTVLFGPKYFRPPSYLSTWRV